MKDSTGKIKMPKPHRPVHPGVPALEWLDDAVRRRVRIASVGCRQLLVENHSGILDLTDEQIRLSTPDGPLLIHGRSLSLNEVRESALIVRGVIRRIDLPETGGEA